MLLESDTAGASAPGILKERVRPDLDSIRAAIAAHMNRVSKQNGRIQINLEDEGTFVIDLVSGCVIADISSGNQITSTLTAKALYVSRLLNNTMEIRSAQLHGWIKIAGDIPGTVRWCDELAGNRFPRQESFTDLPLPTATTDWKLAQRQLREFGYCIIKDAVSAGQLDALRSRLDDQAAAERAAGIAFMDGGAAAAQERRGHNEADGQSAKENAEKSAPNQRVFLLQNKGNIFLELLENPVFKGVVDYYLDEEFTQVAQYSANIVGAGGEPMYLHQDQNSVQPVTPYPMGVNTAFLLDDFTEANGATRLIPGSHIAQRGLAPDNIYSTEGTIAVEAPAGSAILWNSLLWHGTGASQPGQAPRRSIIVLTYLPWVRPHNNGCLSTHPSVFEKMSYDLKSRFGYRVTNGQGSLMVEPEGTIVKWDPDYLIKELHINTNAN